MDNLLADDTSELGLGTDFMVNPETTDNAHAKPGTTGVHGVQSRYGGSIDDHTTTGSPRISRNFFTGVQPRYLLIFTTLACVVYVGVYVRIAYSRSVAKHNGELTHLIHHASRLVTSLPKGHVTSKASEHTSTMNSFGTHRLLSNENVDSPIDDDSFNDTDFEI